MTDTPVLNSVENKIIMFSLSQKVDFEQIEREDLDKKTVIIQSAPSNIELSYSQFKVSNIQRYNPMYSVFFNLTDKNYNNVFFNHRFQFKNLTELYDTTTNQIVKKKSFVKFAPLLDPLRYMTGMYKINDARLKVLPNIHSDSTTCYKKYLSVMNASYIDNFFCFLSNILMDKFNCINCIGYYGSYLGFQERYKISVEDDLEYLYSSDFFKENINKLFFIENGDNLDSDCDMSVDDSYKICSRTNKPKLTIHDDENENIDAVYMDVDVENEFKEKGFMSDCDNTMTTFYEKPVINSTESDDENDTDSEVSVENDDENSISENSDKHNDIAICNDDGDSDSDSDDDDDDDDDDSDEMSIDSSDCANESIAYINNYPVQMICLEKCENTFDYLLENNMLDEFESISALMQIIMTLIIYQKAFSLTHNDLHTNNIMYTFTDKEFVYYKHENVLYKVPTHGRIYKIIDFGRSIYKFQNQLFYSDCFSKGGDANSQYNCNPFLNKKKPTVLPNYSFDVCRLGCSIYDFMFNSSENIDVKTLSPFKRIIYDWCLDDNKNNFLYKKNGEERYPGFLLYKKIARTKNNSTPAQQLKKMAFKQYICKPFDGLMNIIDIDKIHHL
jgi:hypothetical protein